MYKQLAIEWRKFQGHVFYKKKKHDVSTNSTIIINLISENMSPIVFQQRWIYLTTQANVYKV